MLLRQLTIAFVGVGGLNVVRRHPILSPASFSTSPTFLKSYVSALAHLFFGLSLLNCPPTLNCLILLVIWLFSSPLHTICPDQRILFSILCPISRIPKLPLLYFLLILCSNLTFSSLLFAAFHLSFV